MYKFSFYEFIIIHNDIVHISIPLFSKTTSQVDIINEECISKLGEPVHVDKWWDNL